MKKVFVILLLSIGLGAYAQNEAQDPFYYEIISNADKSINFLIGIYPNDMEYVRSADGSGYTKIRMAIINDAAQSFEWADYKVYILLKDGTLFYNYSTGATIGELSCNYTVAAGETHLQDLCFEMDFSVAEIETIYLSLMDNKFFALALSE